MKDNIIKEITKIVLISLIIGFLLEITIFNFRHYESLFFKNETVLNDIKIGEGISCNKNNCVIKDQNKAYIEYNNIDQEIKNLFLDFNGKNSLIIKYTIDFSDTANANYVYGKSELAYVKSINKSKFNRIHSAGKVHNLRINLKSSIGEFSIKEAIINKKVPYDINWWRLALSFILTCFILIIFSKGEISKYKYNGKYTTIISIIVIIGLSFIFFNLVKINRLVNNYSINYYSKAQYNILAKALAKGQFNLDLEVSDNLKKLENPYDPTIKNRKDYYWDYAYYKGKYYTYFGVVPCLLTYLPYFVITKNDLNNKYVLFLGSSLFLVASFFLMKQLCNKYFKKTTYIWYLLLTLFYVFASGVLTSLSFPTFYTVPILFGMLFVTMGLGFWLKSTCYEKLKKRYLTLGSTCMALVAGCRPQMLIASFLAFIIFKDYLFKKEEGCLFSKKSIKETLCALLPFIIIGGLIAYYNYARFGSIFDFGANYNLTTNDMTKRGFKFDRIFLGLYYYLLSPSRLKLIFPFINTYPIETSYIGVTIYENMYGGFFFVNIICLLSLFVCKFKHIIQNKQLYLLCIVSTIMAIVIVIADTQMAGILSRYINDFAFLILISTIIIVLSLLKKINIEKEKLLKCLLVISIIVNCLIFFLGKNLFADNQSQILFYKLYHLFMFWL